VGLAGMLAPDAQLVSDGVHPTGTGYGRLAARFRDAILQPGDGPLPPDRAKRPGS
jgi:hypothetical protein